MLLAMCVLALCKQYTLDALKNVFVPFQGLCDMTCCWRASIPSSMSALITVSQMSGGFSMVDGVWTRGYEPKVSIGWVPGQVCFWLFVYVGVCVPFACLNGWERQFGEW